MANHTMLGGDVCLQSFVADVLFLIVALGKTVLQRQEAGLRSLPVSYCLEATLVH